jgi:predicted phosphodiesterase
MELTKKVQLILLLASCTLIAGCTKEETIRSANQRFNQSVEWNDNHPFSQIMVPSDDYSIYSVGDIHVGSASNLDLMIRKAKNEKASALVMVGDLTNGHVDDYAEFEKHLPNKDSLNYFLIAGNHDLYFDGWKEFYSRLGSSTYMFTVNTPTASDLYICLETGGFTLGRDQFDWLKKILEELRPGYRHCIIFTHVNYFRTRHTFSTNPFSEEVATLTAMFYKHNVDMVVTGHDHEHSFETFGNTTYIIMDALLDGFDQAGYLNLTLSDGKISYSFEKL